MKTLLGIALEEPGFDFTCGLEQINVVREEIDEDYRMLTGKRLQRRNHYRQITHSYLNTEGNKLDIVFRLYDDAVAFRYRIDNKPISSVTQEVSGYSFQNIKNTWSIPYSSGDERFFTKSG